MQNSHLIPVYGQPRTVVRQYAHQRAEVEQQVQLAEDRIAGLHRCGQQALILSVETGRLRTAVEYLMPEQADFYAALMTAVNFGSLQVVASVSRH